MRVCVSLVTQCRCDRVPVAVTCDSESHFWHEPNVARLRLLGFVSDMLEDSCQFGEPCRRRLRIHGHRVPISKIGGLCVRVLATAEGARAIRINVSGAAPQVACGGQISPANYRELLFPVWPSPMSADA